MSTRHFCDRCGTEITHLGFCRGSVDDIEVAVTVTRFHVIDTAGSKDGDRLELCQPCTLAYVSEARP